ncbi:MAG TPA: FMN-binding negative transcriptional regulator [Alphaproteobacteria bacterium]|jgi:transcriptional regulator|nr:FMN-binding negative transcriptional regulator [Alphaproteobacteria bacterium]
MHPNAAFGWTDEAAMWAFVSERAFAHIFAQTPDGPMVAHAPVVVTTAGNLQFHLARANRLVPHLDGLTTLAGVLGDDCYVSPDWYARPNQVPTWLYRAVEAEGPVRRMSRDELVAQLDALSATMEAGLAPKPAWTRAKMADGTFEAMLPGIVGFEMKVTALRGTLKFNQHKLPEDIAGMVAALRAQGRDDVVGLVEEQAFARSTYKGPGEAGA